MKQVVILGATGSIGLSAMDVIARHPDRFRALALSAHRNVQALVEICEKVNPRYAAIADENLFDELAERLRQKKLRTEALAGEAALAELAGLPEADLVLAAIVGGAGLASTFAAARAGKTILLANKESLVMAGALLTDALRASGGKIIPVDSEHNAVLQCLPRDYFNDIAHASAAIRRIVLTASGGPFFGYGREALAAVTPEQACAHPKWKMGRKISVDSATLMNKALEVVEAHWLFGLPGRKIDVVVHPQSIVHSLVEYADGSMLAQLGVPDMRTALAHALAHPERIAAGSAPLDLIAMGALAFYPPDSELFPALPLAYEVLEAANGAAIVLNAANEIAVAAFLAGELPFTNIVPAVKETLAAARSMQVHDLDGVIGLDRDARREATSRVAKLAKGSIR